MTKAELFIVICENYKREIEKVLNSDDFSDVTFKAYTSNCNHSGKAKDNIEELVLNDTNSSSQYIVLGSYCALGLRKRIPPECKIYTYSQCQEFFAPAELLEQYINSGYYIITPGWIENWKDYILDWGFDKEQAKVFFSEFCKKILLLDSNTYFGAETKTKELSDFLEIPYEILNVGTAHFELIIKNIVSEWKLTKVKQNYKTKIEATNQDISLYAMIMDILKDLVQEMNEDGVIEKIVYMFSALFAPSKICYFPFQNGHKQEPYGYPESFVEEITLSSFKELQNRKSSENGFSLTIRRDEKIFGCLLLEDIAFPNFKERYLNTAKALIDIFALVINNARSYQTILEAKEKLRIANQTKSEFLANISHELRTPLNIIMGFSDILRGRIQEEEFHKMLEFTYKAANSLNTLLNGVLELSNVESGNTKLETKPIEIIPIIKEYVELFKIELNKKNVELSLNIGEGIPTLLMLDEVRVRQILFNVIGNAVKFTENGSINITIEHLPKTKGTLDLFISIEDTGIGIQEDKIEKVFDNFYQVDGADTRKYEGIGLGLALSKKLLYIMNGTISVKSEFGKGSTFRIEFKDVRIFE